MSNTQKGFGFSFVLPVLLLVVSRVMLVQHGEGEQNNE